MYQRTARMKTEERFKEKWLFWPRCKYLEELAQTGVLLLGCYQAAVDYEISDFGKVPSTCSQPQCSAKLHRCWEQHSVENPSALAQPKSSRQVMAVLPSKVHVAFIS